MSGIICEKYLKLAIDGLPQADQMDIKKLTALAQMDCIVVRDIAEATGENITQLDKRKSSC